MNDHSKRLISRRQMLKLLGMSTAGLLLASCAPKVAETAAPAPAETKEEVKEAPSTTGLEQGHLTCLLCCGTDDTHELQKRFNEWFEKTYPGITCSLELTPAGQNYFEKLQTLVAAGTPPDVFDMWEGYVAPYAQNGVLMDLTPYVEADPEWKMDDFQPAAVAASSWQGKLYAIVRDFYPGPCMFYYNKDLFDKAKVGYPNANWTWRDMKEAAKALTQDTNNDGQIEQWGLAFEPWFVVWLHWIWSNGGDLFNADETQCALTDPKAYEAIQFWADLVNQDKSAIPSTELSAMQGAANAFRTGVIGMYVGYMWDIEAMRAAREQGLNWSSVLPPKTPSGGLAFYMHLECWAIAAATKLPKAAWQYVRDFTANETANFVKFYPGIPLLKKQIDLFLTEEAKAYDWERIPEIIADPKNIRIPGAGAKFDKISGLVQAELDLVFTGEKTAQQAAEAACPLVNEELARATSLFGEGCHCIT